jgi:N-acetylneuraminic acid mutarotase
MTGIRVCARRALAVSALLLALSTGVSSIGTWSAKAPMPTPQYGHRGAELNGLVHVVGGVHTAVTCSFDATHYVYDPIANTWASKAPMLTARVHPGVAVLNNGVKNLLYVVGGSIGCGPRTASMEAYDPDTDSWTFKAPMPGGQRSTMGVAVVNGILYVVGGQQADSGPNAGMTTLVEAYDPVTNTWTTKAPLPSVRYTMAIGAIDGIVYVAGGGDPFGPLGSVLAFDPATNTWTPRAPMPAVRSGAGSTVANGRLYVVGGSGSSGFLSSLGIYDPVANSWSAGPPLPVIRSELIAVAANGRVFAMGGHDGTNPTADNYALEDTIAPSTTATPSLPPNGNGWNNTDVTVTLNATDAGSGVQSIVYSFSGAQTGGAMVSGNAAAVTITAEGTTTLTYHAVDVAGNVEADHTLTIKIDKTAPLVGAPNGIVTTALSSAGAAVAFTASSSDALSGVVQTTVSPLASGMIFPVGTTHETVTVLDAAGNAAVAGFDVTVMPARPNITVTGGSFIANGSPHPAMATATDSFGAQVAGTFNIAYGPGGASAPVSAGRYSATATFISSDPAFTSTTYPWTAMAPDPHAKTAPSSAVINGKVYVQGFDQDPSGNQSSFVARLSIYDAATNTWSIGASPSLIRQLAMAAAINGKFYVVGGCVMSDCRIGVQGARVLEIYDPASNTWTTGASIPTGRYGAASGVINGKWIVTGGVTECPPCAPTTVTEIYDPASNTWSSGTPIPTSRELSSSAVVNGLLYVIGGYERSSVNASVATVSVYDPVANSWSTRSPMPNPRTGAASGVINNEIYVVGGVPSNAATPANEKYHPASDSWTELAPMLTARQYVSGGGAVVNGRLYVIDGANGPPLANNEMYDPAADATAVITILQGDTTPPSTTGTANPAPNGAGWNKTDVTVTLNATDNVGVQSITYSFLGPQSGGPFTVAGSSANVTIAAEGQTTVTYHATDTNGNVEADHSLTVKIDKTRPFISAPNQLQQIATSSAGAVVNFTVSGSDSGSGLAGSVTVVPLQSGATFPPGTTHETVTATDAAGNIAVALFDVIVNPGRPNINIAGGTFSFDGNPHPASAAATDQSNNSVNGSFSFTYMPGGAPPVAVGRYSATATFTSADPAFTNVLPWTTKAPDPHAKTTPAVTVVNGKLYVHGFDQDAFGNQSSFVPRLSIYDPQANTWSVGASPAIIRAFPSVGTIGGKLYVAGGCVMSDCRVGVTNALEIYNPASDTWSNGTPMPTPRWGAATGVINGNLYVSGGTTPCPPCGTTPVTEVYDPATNSWSTGASIPAARENPASAVVGGLLYVIGGFQRDAANPLTGVSVGTVYAYDPIANSWSTRQSMPVARSTAAVGVVNGEIYVIGGSDGSGALAVSESFNPSANIWTERLPMSTARYYTSAGVVNSTMYVIDGSNGAQLSTNEAYDGALSTTITINPVDTAAPTTNANYPAPNVNGWHRFNVNVNLNAFDSGGAVSPSGVQSITYSLTGAQTGGGTFNTSSTSFTLSNEGTTRVTYHATDNRGNVEADHTFDVKLDKTAPTAANLSNIIVSATSSTGAVVTFDLLSADALSGIDTVVFTQGLPSASLFPHGTTQENVTITDKAGNSTFRSFSVTVNKALLSIAVTPATATVTDGHSASFTATGHFTQGPDQQLPSSGGGSAGGSGGPGPSGVWQVNFSPNLDVSACPGNFNGGFSSQAISSDSQGVVSSNWGQNNFVHVSGTLVTASQVDLTITCNPDNGATGTLHAVWTGTRFEGTATFSGSTVNVVLTGWSTKASMLSPRASFGAATVNGIVHAVGGFNPSLPMSVDAYDPASNSWSTVSQLPTSVEGTAVAAMGGIIYLAGGHVAGGNSSTVFQGYDPSTNSWLQGLAPMPTARANVALVAAGGKLYAIGGSTGSGGSAAATAVVDAYDPSTNQWTSRAPLATARKFHVAGAVNNGARIVVAGGSGDNSVEIYDVAGNTWAAGPAMLASGGTPAAAVVSNALFVFGIGGSGFNVHIYRPSVGQSPDGWAVMASMPTGRGELAVAAVGDVIYAMGGLLTGGSTQTAAVEAFSVAPPSNFSVSSGSAGGSGGGGSSLPTVSWQSSDQSVATTNSSGTATGVAPGQATIIATAAGVSCETTNTCATLTVIPPAHLTLTLAPGSAPVGSVDATVADPVTGQSLEHVGEIPIGATQTIDEFNPFRLLFAAPAGYTVSPTFVDLNLHPGDNVSVPLFFARLDRTPPSVSCGSPDAQWHATDVAIICTASDAGSGLANPVDASFSLSTSVPDGTEDAAAATGTRQVCDNDTNCAIAGPIGPIRVDKKKPALTVSQNVIAEATSIAGAFVSFAAPTASDGGAGVASVSCNRVPGQFSIGTTTVTCTAVDGVGNNTTGGFSVTVRDTIAPIVQFFNLTPDTVLPAGGVLQVQVDVTEAVRTTLVLVNGVNAFQIAQPTPTTGRYMAFVPVPPYGTFTLAASAFDLSGHRGDATLTFDNDGIEAAIDRNRTTAADESSIYSNDFNWNGTAGTIFRGSAVVQATRAGASTVRIALLQGFNPYVQVDLCTGASKYIVLRNLGSAAQVTCAPSGTVTLTAFGGGVELYKRITETVYTTYYSCYTTGGFFSRRTVCYPVQVPHTYTYWGHFYVSPGQTFSTGSPMIASPENTEPIQGSLVQLDDDGTEIPVADFLFDPGESIDVSVEERQNRQDHLTFTGLAGSVQISIDGVTETVVEGSQILAALDFTPPVLTLPADMVVNQTSIGGAIVAFSASAIDNVDGAVAVSCAPASGSLFAVGTTRVTCSASDVHANTASGSFTVTVLSTSQIVDGLIAEIDNFQQGQNLLQNVLKSINAGNVSAACGQLEAFINMVQAQAGKKLTQPEAAALIQAATDAKMGLGCQ